jgi:hypothetical protein
MGKVHLSAGRCFVTTVWLYQGTYTQRWVLPQSNPRSAKDIIEFPPTMK